MSITAGHRYLLNEYWPILVSLEYCLTTTHVKRRWVGTDGVLILEPCDIVPRTELV